MLAGSDLVVDLGHVIVEWKICAGTTFTWIAGPTPMLKNAKPEISNALCVPPGHHPGTDAMTANNLFHVKHRPLMSAVGRATHLRRYGFRGPSPRRSVSPWDGPGVVHPPEPVEPWHPGIRTVHAQAISVVSVQL